MTPARSDGPGAPVLLVALVAIVMLAFAGNSLLNRAAVGAGEIGALEFSLYRVMSGALILGVLAVVTRRRLTLLSPKRLAEAFWLTLYLLGFSIAYVSLDAGVGALILFGGVQLTMFAGAVIKGEPVPARRWVGAALALSGLAWLFWPSDGVAFSWTHGAFMAIAALGWGLYSLAGRRSHDPLASTAANFIWAVPMCWLPLMMVPVSPEALPPTTWGIVLALISGGITSGLGYALWYAVLPRLAATSAALWQLSVPVIAIAGGAILLQESVTPVVIVASALVIAGVALGLSASQRTSGSSGS